MSRTIHGGFYTFTLFSTKQVLAAFHLTHFRERVPDKKACFAPMLSTFLDCCMLPKISFFAYGQFFYHLKH